MLLCTDVILLFVIIIFVRPDLVHAIGIRNTYTFYKFLNSHTSQISNIMDIISTVWLLLKMWGHVLRS